MINLKYCECGCKGYNVVAGDLYFWVYLSLPSEETSVYNTHGGGFNRIFSGTMSAAKKELKKLIRTRLKASIARNKKALDKLTRKK